MYLKSIVIPNSVTEIGSYAFNYCSALESITLGNSLTSLGNDAFSSCHSLTRITLPNSLKVIGESAFSSCTALSSITFGKNVESIGIYCFNWCSSLESVTNLSLTPQAIDETTFYSTYATLHVLPGCKKAYENAEFWKNFTIVEDAEEQTTATPETVSELIATIGKVEFTDACKDKITAARAAYDALPEDLQVLVKNYNVLVETEEAYNKLAATGIADINAETMQKDGKFLNKGRLVIMRNGRKYSSNGLQNVK